MSAGSHRPPNLTEAVARQWNHDLWARREALAIAAKRKRSMSRILDKYNPLRRGKVSGAAVMVHQPLSAPPAPAASADQHNPPPRKPSLRRRIVKWIVDVSLVVVTGLAIIGVLVIWLFEPATREYIAASHNPTADQAIAAIDCTKASILYDETGQLLGAIRHSTAPNCRGFLSASFSTEEAASLIAPLEAVEGELANGARTIHSVDMLGLLRAAISAAELRRSKLDRLEAIEAAREGQPVTFFALAGSPPAISLIEQLIEQAHPSSSIRFKFEMVLAAMVLDARVSAGNDAARAHLFAENFEVLHSRGRQFSGKIAALHLFEKAAPDSLAEKCIWATASGFALVEAFPGAPDSILEQSRSRLERAKRRASELCVPRLAASTAEAAEARAAIARFSLPEQPFPSLSPSEIILLRDYVSGFAGTPPSELHLSLDRHAQRALEASVSAILPGINNLLPEGLCIGAPCTDEAEMVIAVAEIAGSDLPLRTAWTNTNGLFEPTRLGSQNKSGLILIAARASVKFLCNRETATGMRNANGIAPVADCDPRDLSQPGWIPLDFAIAESMNNPFAWLARERYPEVVALETGLSWVDNNQGPHGAALGLTRVSPAQMMSLFGAIAAGGRGVTPRTSGLSLTPGGNALEVDLARLGFTQADVAEAARLLSAPLAGGGTLSSFNAALAGTGCVPLMGKSGSPEVEGSNAAMTRSATLVVACGAKEFVIFASVSTGNGRVALAGFRTHDLGPLVRAAALAVNAKPTLAKKSGSAAGLGSSTSKT